MTEREVRQARADGGGEQQEDDPRMASPRAQARAAELRAQIEAEMTGDRRRMAIRAAAGLAVLIAAVVVIRQVRKRAQG